MDFSFLPKYYMFFLNGAKITLLLAFFTIILGVIFGLIFCLMRMSRVWPLKAMAASYIEFIRGTPFLVQLFLIYYGLPNLGVKLPDFSLMGVSFPDFSFAVIALSINSSAYVAEVFRAGIQAIDKGQMEAARSLGLSHVQAMRFIVLPQAFKNVLPALGNEFIIVVKDSSLVSVIGIGELMYSFDTVRGNTFQTFGPLAVVALIYFVMTFTLSKLLGLAERRMRTYD
ncbi:polar amino acid transport system permease protein [Paenibacillus sp. UNCCL117]|uniref:amino acid ABC transporter permease n=1 Tax=unclassified Paenibacillus TaxID=185978 RepID=UPI00087F5FC4|nr:MULTISPECIES: amino acid ABC transporter permease [unclassified Paenibacillus]SDC52708.1 amino acid ABC transporter membrane protein, PAAT family [Paenibacillus sp. cl123]SFW11261.1 polar amino acid transport system permease protein [Paenibacillus sp. UNCCL117]